MGWTCVVVAAAVCVLGLVLYVLGRSPHYTKMFSDEHVVEFAEAVARLKSVALERIEEFDKPRLPDPNDPRRFRTSGGIFLLYTITREGGNYLHHYSLRDDQGYTAQAVGRTFAILAAMVLGVDPMTIRIERSENAVFHAEFTLDEAGQCAFTDRPPLTVTKEQARRLQDEAIKAHRHVSFGRMKTGVRYRR